MASAMYRPSGLAAAVRNVAAAVGSTGSKCSGRTWTPCRTAVTTSSGAVLPKPPKTSFGLVRIGVVVVPFLYVGTLISKNFAALLEEHDIFVPEDDDDDD
ncbi:essential MCU regulator, mitochondrial [Denticeps clupeoides]|uniref:Essential MCU regulator, mitochondrial n=1 Tax=Denticeps clupeoides TaxID=299321 RepID=A0AAY4D3K6_9TELE|nr:essential MCU regulator, mitochondrial [Denticeps clupeoides]